MKNIKNKKGFAVLFVFCIFFVIIVLCFAAFIYFTEFNEKEYTVTILEKERVNYGEDSKYLIFCETEQGESIVFQNTDLLFRGKFNSSDIYGQLQVGGRYKITAVGFRIQLLSSYENILFFEEVTE